MAAPRQVPRVQPDPAPLVLVVEDTTGRGAVDAVQRASYAAVLMDCDTPVLDKVKRRWVPLSRSAVPVSTTPAETYPEGPSLARALPTPELFMEAESCSES